MVIGRMSAGTSHESTDQKEVALDQDILRLLDLDPDLIVTNIDTIITIIIDPENMKSLFKK